ncbi:hypothetical protein LXA47_31325 [Massilia sp. P8910]|uniref:hypothetical protein n=1 Tax=Massilia antarctica TaxID=2765360 RepID=UPI001E4EEBA7|nr:hypothetical protein [Massilia antarctica]MCE3608063.1 hypothetical protein [Massilia antarctica]
MTARHVPTDEVREIVRRLSQVGIPQEDIAEALAITRPTLDKHYKKELKTAKIIMLADVCGALYKNAMDGNVAAQIFIMKTRGPKGEWSTTDRFEHTGAEGQPLSLAPPMINVNFIPKADPDGTTS